MGKTMTAQQRIARPVINFLVERYFPNGLFFYGGGPLKTFDRYDAERRSGIGTMAALSLARHASEQNASKLSVEAEGVTINNEDHGDWRITVERIAKGPPHENELEAQGDWNVD